MLQHESKFGLYEAVLEHVTDREATSLALHTVDSTNKETGSSLLIWLELILTGKLYVLHSVATVI